MSKLTFDSALTSNSQALQPPADTERSLSERPKRWRSAADTCTGSGAGRVALSTSPSRVVLANLKSLLNESLALGQAGAQSPQVTQRPRSIDTGSAGAGCSVIARVGQAVSQAWQPVSQARSAITGRPRKPTGLAWRGSGMNCEPC